MMPRLRTSANRFMPAEMVQTQSPLVQLRVPKWPKEHWRRGWTLQNPKAMESDSSMSPDQKWDVKGAFLGVSCLRIPSLFCLGGPICLLVVNENNKEKHHVSLPCSWIDCES